MRLLASSGFSLTKCLALSVLVGATACSAETIEEDVGSTDDKLLEGRVLSPAEVEGLLRAAGATGDAVPKLVCAAKYESGFYERASNRNRNGSIDRGLFQINSLHLGRAGCPSNGDDLFDAPTNARCAVTVFRSQGIGAWYGYKAHRGECESYSIPGGGGGQSQEKAGPPTANPAGPTACGTLKPGQGLVRGQELRSCDGRLFLAMQHDGNVVLYDNGRPLWASNTSGSDASKLWMQSDGNLVVYNDTSNARWSSSTSGAAEVAVQNDGNMVIYSDGRALWATHTNR